MLDMHLQYRTNRTWAASTTLPDGRQIRATAYIGASNKLARMLRGMGVPDQSMRLFNPTGNQALERASFYAWADFDWRVDHKRWVDSLVEPLEPVLTPA